MRMVKVEEIEQKKKEKGKKSVYLLFFLMIELFNLKEKGCVLKLKMMMLWKEKKRTCFVD